MKRSLISSLIFSCALLLMCSCAEKRPQITTSNPARFITDEARLEMLRTLKDPDGTGRILEMNYTADYKLRALVESDVTNMKDLLGFIAGNLYDVVPDGFSLHGVDAGCSAFAATDSTGGYMMGRNYDYCHVEDSAEVPLTMIVVRTAPEGGKKSVSFVDSYWIGYRAGFYTDSITDLSSLVAAPYVPMDGMNEDGFAMGILHLSGKTTLQSDPQKKTLWSSLVIRYMLDNAGSVEEAIELMRQFNISMASPAGGSFHFFMADAGGDYAIVEFSFPDGSDIETSEPNVTKFFRGADSCRYVTNFYVDPLLAENTVIGAKSNHGKGRYDTMKDTLEMNVYKLSREQGMRLLGAVATDSNPERNTSHTQWSALYDLSNRTVDVSILKEYDTRYTYSIPAAE